MTISELKDNLSHGGEIEFVYMGKSYSITHVNRMIYISEFYKEDETAKFCKNFSDLLTYEIQGELFENIWDKVEITFRCF